MTTNREHHTSPKEAYNIVRRSFHDPSVPSSVASALQDEFCKEYPTGSLRLKLKAKHLLYRRLHPGKFKNAPEPAINGEILSVHSPGHPKDMLLVSHEMSLTGAPRALLTLAVELKAIGYNPIIFALKNGPLTDEAQNKGITVVADRHAWLSGMAFNRRDKRLETFFNSFGTILVNTLDAVKQCQWLHLSGSRLIAWIHEAERTYELLGIDNLDSLLEPYDEIYVVGEWARAHAAKRMCHHERLSTLLYGIDATEFRASGPTSDTGKLHILMAGAIDERKGHHMVLKALQLLDNSIKTRITVHIAGPVINHSLARELKKQGDVIEFHGALPHHRLMQMLGCSDALLCPSLDDPMPIVCTEAFQLCKPVIVSDHTGTAAFIRNGENGFLVKGGDAHSLADGIKTLIDSKHRLPEIGRLSHSIYTDFFSPEVFRKNIVKIFPPML